MVIYWVLLILVRVGTRGIAQMVFACAAKCYLRNTCPCFLMQSHTLKNGMLHVGLRELGMLQDYATNL